MSTEQTRVTQSRYDRQASLYDLKELPMELLGFKRLRKHLWQSVKAGRVLEIGVGTGKNIPYHPEGARVVALDISPKMLVRAAAKARREGRHVDLVSQTPKTFRSGARRSMERRRRSSSVPCRTQSAGWKR
jgi:ubiquinone/menaquinone biosynthesis C-methylase UbiE